MPGYHTIQLPSSIALAANNSFAVAVKLIAPNETMPIAIEDYEPNYSSKATASVGQSFVSPDGKNWTDLMQSQPSLKANVCLKAFTSNSTVTPAVVSSAPVNGAVNVSNTTPITVTLNTAVQKGINFSAISVKDSTGKSVTISSTIKESVLTINANLAAGTKYIVTIPQKSVVSSSNTTFTKDYSFSFTTLTPKVTPLTIVSTSPSNGQTGVGGVSTISISFSANIKMGSDFNHFSIVDSNGNKVGGFCIISGNKLMVYPVLRRLTKYTVTVTNNSFTDLQGNAMNNNYTFSFTTSR